jgi:hypothetical protein
MNYWLTKKINMDRSPMRLEGRGVVRGLILFRSADLAMGRDGWNRIIIY